MLIPGVTDSTEPYDAPNGALCVNFNTVNFQSMNGKYTSVKPQTPLLPMVISRIKKTGLPRGRITAKSLHTLLLNFEPQYRLLRQDGKDFYKTGTLKDIRTRVGFVGRDRATRYAYVILCNTPGKSATPIRNQLFKILSR